MKNTFSILFMIVLLTSCGIWNKNSDNTIYIPGKAFHFKVSYLDSTGFLLKTQQLDLLVTDGFYPERKQTQIVWTLHEDAEEYTDKTGVVDGDYFFIHQPRIRDMKILSFAEFPSISKATLNNPTTTSISEGTVSMAKSYNSTTITKVKTTQKYVGVTNITLQGMGQRKVFFLDASATSELGTILGKYYFDKEYGFIKMDFILPDKQHILIEMIGRPE